MFVRLDNRGQVQIGSGLVRQEAGLGSILKTAFSRMGLPACGGCERRAEWLDRHVVMVPSGQEVELKPYD